MPFYSLLSFAYGLRLVFLALCLLPYCHLPIAYCLCPSALATYSYSSGKCYCHTKPIALGCSMGAHIQTKQNHNTHIASLFPTPRSHLPRLISQGHPILSPCLLHTHSTPTPYRVHTYRYIPTPYIFRKDSIPLLCIPFKYIRIAPHTFHI